MNNIYEAEEQYLKYVKECIDNELRNATDTLENISKKKVTYDDAKRGDQFTKEALMTMYSTRINRLYQIMNSPYFARIDYTQEDSNSNEKLYIGKTSLMDQNNHLAVIDWRSPISSMYYDNSVGQAKYLSPSGIISCFISLKRQIIIENQILKSILDTDLVTNDEILQEYLDVHADNRMKSIVASIQKEQNRIIRYDGKKDIIVQGVAGSGKTSVALHRIAYLVYLFNNSNNQKVNSNQFMIIGPNNYFLDYISGVLPDLEVESVNQRTIYDLAKESVDEKITILEPNSELQDYYKFRSIDGEKNIKTTDEFRIALDKYLENIITYYCTTDLIIYDKVLFSGSAIAQYLSSSNGNYREKAMNLEKLLIKKVKDDYDSFSEMLTSELRKKALSFPKESETRLLLFEKISLINKEVKLGLSKQIKKHFEKLTKKVLPQYINFIESIDKFINFENSEYFKKESLKRLSKKVLTRDDVGPLLYMKTKFEPHKENRKFIHVIVDEAQDLGMLEFIVLKEIFPNATFSIFGDANQSIFSYRAINDWESVKNTVFAEKCNIFYMNQSYRTTNEIMGEANKISNYLTGTISDDVIRHGEDVKYINYEKSQDLIKILINKLEEYIGKGYKSIALISKTDSEAKKLNQDLINFGLDINNVNSEDEKYKGGICTISSSLAKGLEFDATILINVNCNNYNPEYDIDMKLLYVAFTRALHETSVIYDGELPHVLTQKKVYQLKK